jgi:hypothetical protein
MNTFTNYLKTLGSNIEKGQGLDAEPQTLSQDQALIWWQSFSGKAITGWVQFSDMNLHFTAGFPQATPLGPILAAEFYLEQTSYQLRQVGSQWVAVKLTQQAKQDSYLETVTHLADKDEKHSLCYQVEWSGSPLRPVASRLIEMK